MKYQRFTPDFKRSLVEQLLSETAAHSRPYIQPLAKEHGFVVELCQSAGIRKEQGQWIMGDVFILKLMHS